jgi:hypothetical protein
LKQRADNCKRGIILEEREEEEEEEEEVSLRKF